MKHAILFAVSVYRTLISPMLHTLVPVRSGCRLSPSCSVYCYEAVHRFGAVRGTWFGILRLTRCHPFSRHSS